MGGLIAIILLLSLPAVPTYAQLLPPPVPAPIDLNSRSAGDQRRVQPPATRITKRRAAELATQAYGGNVLRISLIGQGDNLRYQLRMEKEGKIFTVYVDANSGAVSTGE
ncbi:MAG: PepSY domain-containing protein [Pseudohongiellaceae bacterium]